MPSPFTGSLPLYLSETVLGPCEPFADVKRFMCDAHTEQFLQRVLPNVHVENSLVRLFHI